jgi:hypothetical protein
MGTTRLYPLSFLLENAIQPDYQGGIEGDADACLASRQYELAASGYYQLDAADPRIASKVAYCEWMTGNGQAAFDRLMALGEELDIDGVGLLGELICTRYGDKQRSANMESIWPRLKAATSADSVPLVAAEARSQYMWPGDLENREQRRDDIERLLALHPNSQRIRLKALSELQSANASFDEQYALLHNWSNSNLIPRYQWEAACIAAEAGQFDEALNYLRQVEERERESAQPSRDLLLNVALARYDIAARSSNGSDLSRFDEILSDALLDWDDIARVVRAALAAACHTAQPGISALCDRLLTILETSPYGFAIDASALHNEPYPVSGDTWDDYAHTWSCGDLAVHEDVLLASSQGRANQFFRAAFTATRIDEKFNDEGANPSIPKEFWDDIAALLGEVEESDSEFGGKLLSLHTAVRAHRQRPNWATIGQCWITSELFCHASDAVDTHGWLTLKSATRAVTYARSFTSGVLKHLRDNAIRGPEVYDVAESLVSKLVDISVSDAFRLLTVLAEGDNRPDVQFYLGLAAQRTDRAVEARAAYKSVLEQDSTYHSAIFNALLLCTTHADTPFLEYVAPFVDQYSDEDTAEKQELTQALASARQRCVDKNIAKREAIETELSKYPPLLTREIGPEDISLRAAVALMALFRCGNAEPGDDVILPFEGSALPFSPVISGRRILFDLLHTGLVAVHPKTSIDAFSVEDGAVRGWRLGRMTWALSRSCESLMDQLRSLNGFVPDSWRRDIQTLALEIARGEVCAYLNFLAQERGWPEPRDTEELADLARVLVNEVPVSQAFHLSYLGAMSASDYKQKYPVSAQQAADMLIRRTGQRLESVREGRFPARSFDRPWKLPRSAVSFALWGTILNMEDVGFSQRISDLATGV